VRSVPIPPVLVSILREHIDTYGVEGEHRVFRSGRGGHLQETAYAKVWRTARQVALTPVEAASRSSGARTISGMHAPR
jgi:hypothetical protein